MKVSRLWLQTYFDTELPSAEALEELLTTHAFEVEGVEVVGNDAVIDVDVLANRSSDCLSHRGIARELSTLLSLPLTEDPLRMNLPLWPTAHRVQVDVADQTLCPRYMVAVVRGVSVGPSPAWLSTRLESIGQRSINNIVDATNYVMFNLGQPLHAFDLAKLARDADGTVGIEVRPAHENEAIVTLTGDERTLSPRHLVIADKVSGDSLAIAGIKGGKIAEIDSGTVDLVLESAHFDYTSVRKTSRELKLTTDASVRFQNEPARELPAFALRDLIELIQRIAGGELIGVRDVYVGPRERQPVDVTLSEINRLLGTTLSYDDVERILIRFDWEFSRAHDEFAITSPWERTDLTYPQAFIEEIGRVYGYANITGTMPPHCDHPTPNRTQYYTDKIRTMLTERGYSEVLTYTLRNSGNVALVNPLASDKSHLRASLTEGLSQALSLNVNNAPLLGLDDIRLFEIGTVWSEHGEDTALALGVRAVRGKQAKLEKALIEDMHAVLAILGAPPAQPLSVTEGVAEITLDPFIMLAPTPGLYEETLAWHVDARFSPWSRYPFMARDIAVWVPADTSIDVVQSIVLEKATDLLVRCDTFDTFTKEGRTSYAWHLVFQSKERTLTDEEVGGIMSAITNALNACMDWEVR